MKNQFKLLVLMLITSVLSHSQSHQILKESFSVDKSTSIVLNFANIYVAIEESTDDKVHFDFLMEFEGYSKKEIKEKIEEITTEVSSFDNHITLNVNSKNQITFELYKYNVESGIILNNDEFFNKKKDTIIRKSKDSLLAEIRLNNAGDRTNNPLKYINNR